MVMGRAAEYLLLGIVRYRPVLNDDLDLADFLRQRSSGPPRGPIPFAMSRARPRAGRPPREREGPRL
jgi:hypothetical protein